MLHRDVKPANILCHRFGEPALADFGLAVLVETRDESMTLETLTPAYAPPRDVPAAYPAGARGRRVRAVRHALRADARAATALASRSATPA